MRRIGDQPILKTNQMVDYKNYALTSYAHIPQNVLVKHLYSEIKEHVIFDHQLVDLKQEQNIQIKLKSKDNLINIQCERLYGCDGYNGFVRQALGIQMKGQQNIQSFLNIHFTSQELIKQTGEYGSMLHFIYNSNVVGVLIKHSIQNGEFALQIPLDLLYNGSDSLKIQQITKDNSLINQLMNGITNKKLSDINVKSVGLWKMNAVIAEKYYDKNCILVGDACHSMPPAGGFGMNTGIQDAYNLAFKINDNVDLFNYELERKQIGQQNIATALKYYKVSLDIAKQLGFSYSLLKNYQHITNMIPFASNQLFQYGIKLGSSFIENNFIYNQLRIKNQIPLVFPNEDIGYQYTKGHFDFSQPSSVGKLASLEIRKQLQPFKWYSINHKEEGMEFLNTNNENKLIIRPDQHNFRKI